MQIFQQSQNLFMIFAVLYKLLIPTI